jgi:uncharacterized protein
VATPAQRPFRLTGADGRPLSGDVKSAAGSRPAVLICRGRETFKDWGGLPYLGDRLARAGFAAVSFTYSGLGIRADVRDLEVLLGALSGGSLGLRPTAFGLMGHGLGGALAVLGAAQDERVGGLVTWAMAARLDRVTAHLRDRDMPYELEAHSETLDFVRAAGRVRAPWLIVHGAADELVPVDDAHELCRAARHAELLVVAGQGHTFGAPDPWAGSTPSLDRVVQATLDWFARHLS